MENTLWSDILAQKTNLGNVVRHLYTGERACVEAAATALRDQKPILFVGVASAAYSSMPAESYFRRHGRFASVLCASEALYSTPAQLEGAHVVVNSRSGETAEVVKLARLLHDRGIPFVAITNEPDSTVARLATYLIWAKTHKDHLVSINVVTGMMTAALVLASAVVGKMDALREDLEQLADAMSAAVETSIECSSGLLAFFAGCRPLHLLYRGAYEGSAKCARLVLEEVARTPSVPLGAAEFRQGPNEVIDEEFGAVVFLGRGERATLNLSLCHEIVQCGGRVAVITADSDTGMNVHDRMLVISLPAVAEDLMPVLAVVPLQLLAYRLAEAQGYEPGDVRYIAKVILSEHGVPNAPQAAVEEA